MTAEECNLDNYDSRHGVMSLADGFEAYEVNKDRSQDWHFLSFWDVARQQFLSPGSRIMGDPTLFRLARFRLRNRYDQMSWMRKQFIRELSVGMIDAIGYSLPRCERDKPVLIPRHVWEHADLNWERAEVSGAGLAFAYVRILMPFSSGLLRDTDFIVWPLPELGHFYPSEEQRLRICIPDSQPAKLDGAQSGIGRPSHRDAIRQAYEALKRNGFANKQLYAAIRDSVKQANNLNTDEGLGDSTIEKHVIEFRKEERHRKN